MAKTIQGLPGLEHVEAACVEINGLGNAGATVRQVDKSGRPYARLPRPTEP